MRKVLVAVLSLALLCTACSTAWVSTLDSILAAAAPALIDILEIAAAANGQTVSTAEVAKINNDAASIKTLAADFASASSLAAPGVCSQLQAAISTYQADQQLVLSTALVGEVNTQTKIALLSNLIAGTVDAILAVIPSCQASPSPAFKSNPPLSLKNFVASYNATLTAKTGNSAVDALTANLKLHQHSRVLRALTFGRLQ
jgi:hypothetical protein